MMPLHPPLFHMPDDTLRWSRGILTHAATRHSMPKDGHPAIHPPAIPPFPWWFSLCLCFHAYGFTFPSSSCNFCFNRGQTPLFFCLHGCQVYSSRPTWHTYTCATLVLTAEASSEVHGISDLY